MRLRLTRISQMVSKRANVARIIDTLQEVIDALDEIDTDDLYEKVEEIAVS